MLPQALRPFDEADALPIKIFVKIQRVNFLGFFQTIKIKMIYGKLAPVVIHQNKGGAVDFFRINFKRLGQAFDKGGFAGTQLPLQKNNVPGLEL